MTHAEALLILSGVREQIDRLHALMPAIPFAASPEDLAADHSGYRMLMALTPREREVVGCIADGMNRNLISERFGISIDTTARHISNICNKWGADSSLEIAVCVYRHPVLKEFIPIPSIRSLPEHDLSRAAAGSFRYCPLPDTPVAQHIE